MRYLALLFILLLPNTTARADPTVMSAPQLDGFTALNGSLPWREQSFETITHDWSDGSGISDTPSKVLLRETTAAQPKASASVRMVAEALSRAIAQGLIEVSEESSISDPNRSNETVSPTIKKAQVSVSTDFDRATLSDRSAQSPTNVGNLCINRSRLDISSWGDAKNVNLLGELRSAVMQEDGTVNEAGARTLARYYLYLGFGLEAETTALHLTRSEDRILIRALGEIMDDGSTKLRVFEGLAACKGPSSLWAILAAQTDPQYVPVSADSILQAFSELPRHLRVHLGPLLSERLHDLGMENAARIAISAGTRGGTHTDESDLATARLELKGTHASQARTKLAEITSGTNETAAWALVELFQDAENRDMPPNLAWIVDSIALIDVLEGTEVSKDLSAAALRGLVALGSFDEFRVRLAKYSPNLSEDDRHSLSVLALTAAGSSASDADFLKTVLALSKQIAPDDLQHNTRVHIANRMRSLGLFSHAARIMPGEIRSLAELESYADVLAHVGRSEEALSTIRRSKFEGADELLAKLYEDLGEEEKALELRLKHGVNEHTFRLALRTANWTAISRSTPRELTEATTSLVVPQSHSESTKDQSNKRLIEDVRIRREHIHMIMRASRPAEIMNPFIN